MLVQNLTFTLHIFIYYLLFIYYYTGINNIIQSQINCRHPYFAFVVITIIYLYQFFLNFVYENKIMYVFIVNTMYHITKIKYNIR